MAVIESVSQMSCVSLFIESHQAFIVWQTKESEDAGYTTYGAVGPMGLHTSRVVILNATARLSLRVFGLLDQTDYLSVLTDARWELGPQVDQVLLKSGGINCCGNIK